MSPLYWTTPVKGGHIILGLTYGGQFILRSSLLFYSQGFSFNHIPTFSLRSRAIHLILGEVCRIARLLWSLLGGLFWCRFLLFLGRWRESLGRHRVLGRLCGILRLLSRYLRYCDSCRRLMS